MNLGTRARCTDYDGTILQVCDSLRDRALYGVMPCEPPCAQRVLLQPCRARRICRAPSRPSLQLPLCLSFRVCYRRVDALQINSLVQQLSTCFIARALLRSITHQHHFPARANRRRYQQQLQRRRWHTHTHIAHLHTTSDHLCITLLYCSHATLCSCAERTKLNPFRAAIGHVYSLGQPVLRRRADRLPDGLEDGQCAGRRPFARDARKTRPVNVARRRRLRRRERQRASRVVSLRR